MSMMNRRGNARNMYQTQVPKVLCVCSAGLLRSPTAANVLHKEYGYNTRAAGASSEYALVPVDEVLLHWADEVVFMSPENREEVERTHGEALAAVSRVVTLNVPDMYEWNAPQLKAAILEQYPNAL